MLAEDIFRDDEYELPVIMQEMMDTINYVDDYAKNKDELGGLDWGMESLNTAFEGLNAGVHFVVGAPNTGKSCVCLNMAWNIVQANKNREKPAYVIYIGLDDSVRELIPRIVALDQRIPINLVSKPKKYAKITNMEAAMARREIGIKNLKDNIRYLKIMDQSTSPGCDNIESVERIVKHHLAELRALNENYQLVLFIDNFHDMNSEIGYYGDEFTKFNSISKQLTAISTVLDMPIICTAEARKQNGLKRMTQEDVSGGYGIAYDAKGILLCFNEVGIKGENANLYWEQEGYLGKRPVLEVRVGKNKQASFKQTIFFEFVPEMAYIREATPAGSIRYSQMIGG